jgi:hypothetical protein
MTQSDVAVGQQDATSFSILHEDNEIRVYKNSSNEIFVEDRKSGTKMRIHSYSGPKGGLQFTTTALVEPIRVTNMIGWRIGPR